MAATSIALAPPSLGAGYYARIFARETRYEFTRLLRTRAFSLSVIGLPVMFYLLFGVANRHTFFARYLMASYSCMGVVSACLFGVGMGIALDRVQGWLELKQASPMPAAAYLCAKMISCAAFALIIIALLLALGVTLGGATLTAGECLRLTGVILAGSLPFSAMGLVVSLLVPASAGPGILNMIYLPMCFISGFWIPMNMLPHWVRIIAPALPTYHLGQVSLHILGYAEAGSMMPHWEFLAGFTLLMLGCAWLLFVRSEAQA